MLTSIIIKRESGYLAFRLPEGINRVARQQHHEALFEGLHKQIEAGDVWFQEEHPRERCVKYCPVSGEVWIIQKREILALLELLVRARATPLVVQHLPHGVREYWR